MDRLFRQIRNKFNYRNLKFKLNKQNRWKTKVIDLWVKLDQGKYLIECIKALSKIIRLKLKLSK